jgi:DNA-binding NtrC family response regulator
LLRERASAILAFKMLARVLLVDTEGASMLRLMPSLSRRFSVSLVTSAELAAFGGCDVVVLAPSVPRPFEVCQRLRRITPPPDVIVLAHAPNLNDTVDAIRAGASDLISSLGDAARIVTAVQAALDRRGIDKDIGWLKAHHEAPTFAPELLGESVPVQQLRKKLEAAAANGAPLLLLGECGSGKTLAARCIHSGAGGDEDRFVALRCDVSTAGDDIVVMLQQHGADSSVYLDEIAALDTEQQAALLQTPFAARLIVGSQRDLAKEVQRGRFREDLYNRLKATQLYIPPLRERGRDVLLLAQHFLNRASTPARPLHGFTTRAAAVLLKHHWPGNVRELAHCVAAAAASACYNHLTAADLPHYLTRERGADSAKIEVRPLHRIEQAHILKVLDSVDGNKQLASRMLGIDRKTLHRKLSAYRLSPNTKEARP